MNNTSSTTEEQRRQRKRRIIQNLKKKLEAPLNIFERLTIHNDLAHHLLGINQPANALKYFLEGVGLASKAEPRLGKTLRLSARKMDLLRGVCLVYKAQNKFERLDKSATAYHKIAKRLNDEANQIEALKFKSEAKTSISENLFELAQNCENGFLAKRKLELAFEESIGKAINVSKDFYYISEGYKKENLSGAKKFRLEALLMLAGCYLVYGQLEDDYYAHAIRLFSRCYKEAQKQSENLIMGRCLNNLGVIYQNRGEDAKALRFFEEYLKNVKKYSEFWRDEISARKCMSFVQRRLKKLDPAILQLRNAVILGRKHYETPEELTELENLKRRLKELKTFKTHHAEFSFKLRRFQGICPDFGKKSLFEWSDFLKLMIQVEESLSLQEVLKSNTNKFVVKFEDHLQSFLTHIEKTKETGAERQIKKKRLDVLGDIVTLLTSEKELKPFAVKPFERYLEMLKSRLEECLRGIDGLEEGFEAIQKRKKIAEEYYLSLMDYADLLDDLGEELPLIEGYYSEALGYAQKSEDPQGVAAALYKLEVIYKSRKLIGTEKLESLSSRIDLFGDGMDEGDDKRLLVFDYRSLLGGVGGGGLERLFERRKIRERQRKEDGDGGVGGGGRGLRGAVGRVERDGGSLFSVRPGVDEGLSQEVKFGFEDTPGSFFTQFKAGLEPSQTPSITQKSPDFNFKPTSKKGKVDQEEGSKEGNESQEEFYNDFVNNFCDEYDNMFQTANMAVPDMEMRSSDFVAAVAVTAGTQTNMEVKNSPKSQNKENSIILSQKEERTPLSQAERPSFFNKPHKTERSKSKSISRTAFSVTHTEAPAALNDTTSIQTYPNVNISTQNQPIMARNIKMDNFPSSFYNPDQNDHEFRTSNPSLSRPTHHQRITLTKTPIAPAAPISSIIQDYSDLIGAPSHSANHKRAKHRGTSSHYLKPLPSLFSSNEWFGPFNLKSLAKKFDLSDSLIGDKMAIKLVDFVSKRAGDHTKVHPIKILRLKNCNLSETFIEHIMTKCTSTGSSQLYPMLTTGLGDLDLSSNDIKLTEETNHLLESLILGSSESLTFLDLSCLDVGSEEVDVKTKGKFIALVVKVFQRMDRLAVLALRRLNLQFLYRVPDLGSETVQRLDLAQNQLDALSIVRILTIRALFPKLKKIDLSGQKPPFLAENMIDEHKEYLRHEKMDGDGPGDRFEAGIDSIKLKQNLMFLKAMNKLRDDSEFLEAFFNSIYRARSLDLSENDAGEAFSLMKKFAKKVKKSSHKETLGICLRKLKLRRMEGWPLIDVNSFKQFLDCFTNLAEFLPSDEFLVLDLQPNNLDASHLHVIRQFRGLGKKKDGSKRISEGETPKIKIRC